MLELKVVGSSLEMSEAIYFERETTRRNSLFSACLSDVDNVRLVCKIHL